VRTSVRLRLSVACLFLVFCWLNLKLFVSSFDLPFSSDFRGFCPWSRLPSRVASNRSEACGLRAVKQSHSRARRMLPIDQPQIKKNKKQSFTRSKPRISHKMMEMENRRLWVDKHRPTSFEKLNFHQDLTKQLETLVRFTSHPLVTQRLCTVANPLGRLGKETSHTCCFTVHQELERRLVFSQR
jgi:hypothetical protein